MIRFRKVRVRPGRPQQPRLSSGQFELHRIGDAVASRNVHSAIYDSLRLCMAL
ncbi:MAG TPA: hypothetical protein VKQ09_03555 [Sphingomonas sp.]|jgi:hypothetical protein|nr:hypothetical protein [Sphingomonas sp.]